MSDCVSREYLLNHRTYIIADGLRLPVIELDTVKNAPSVEPERAKGHWEIYKQHQEEWLICDQCRRMYHRWYFDENFCPNCGADMREEEPDVPITREEIEKGITTYVDGKYDPIYLGSSPHDGPMYKCSKCGRVYSSWEWLGKKEFTCICGATWNVPE